MLYPYIKSLHLIFVITWFAGLFYVPRLFVYQIETYSKEVDVKKILLPQLRLMTMRLWYIITWPSAILAVGFAIWLLILNPGWLSTSWMQVKLGFVALLVVYQLYTQKIYKESSQRELSWSSNRMRLYNEVPTIVLFAVVFLAILKSAVNWIYGVVGIFGLIILLMLLFKIYQRTRKG